MPSDNTSQPEAETSANEHVDSPTDADPTRSGPKDDEIDACVVDDQGQVSSETRDLQDQLAAARDAALRAQADSVNVQRRADQEIEKARKFALERLCGDLLGVVDNLERALESTTEETRDSALVKGIELTRKGFIDVLTKYGVSAVNPIGEPFNPETAQAVTMVEQPDSEPNTVTAVMQKGYLLKDRLLRPAMVVVSKAGS